MVSVCFSSAAILRCDMLSTMEYILLIIPVALQALITSVVLTMLWHRGRRQLFIACEGWITLILSLLDLLSQLYPGPAGRSNLNVFRALDTIIGAMSFLPILFYSLFLCSLTIADFTVILPPYLKRATRLFFFFFVPLLAVLNEVASFNGITYSLAPTPMIVFRTNHAKDLWFFFDSTTLAIFTAFQSTIWCFSTFRIIQILLERRQPDFQIRNSTPKLHGLGWVNMGIVLGATETVIGFAVAGCFPVVLGRRIVRLVSRGLFCVGLFIGLDQPSGASFAEVDVDSTLSIEKAMWTPYGESSIKPFISNPRTSTFQHLSPTATTFHQRPRAPSVPAPKGPRAPAGLPGMSQFASLKDGSTSPLSNQRVTILFEQGTPKLDVRLSMIELPYPPPLPATDNASYRGFTPILNQFPRPFVPPFAGEGMRDSTGSSLDDAKIVSVPRTVYIAEMTKATVIRTPSGRTLNRSASELSALSLSLESVKTKETKGKRVMSGEKNQEFFQMLMKTGLRPPTSPPAAQTEESVGAFNRHPSIVVSSYGPDLSREGEGQYASRPLSSYSQPGSRGFSQEFSSPDWLSMGSTPGTMSRYTSLSVTVSEHAQQQDSQTRLRSVRSTDIMNPQSFLYFDSSSRPSTEEFYGKLFRPSPELLSRQISEKSHRSASYTRHGVRRSSTQSYYRRGSLTARTSLRLARGASTRKRPQSPPPPRPQRNPTRPPTQLPLSPSQMQDLPATAPKELSQLQQPVSMGGAKADGEIKYSWGELSSKGTGEQREVEQTTTVGIAPRRTTPLPRPARHTPKPSLTTELLFVSTEEAQRRYGIAAQVVVEQEGTPPSPTDAESISVYSRESAWFSDQRHYNVPI